MSVTKASIKKTDAKSEFFIELADRHAYWSEKNPEYAKAYERLLYAFTSPEAEKTKKDQ